MAVCFIADGGTDDVCWKPCWSLQRSKIFGKPTRSFGTWIWNFIGLMFYYMGVKSEKSQAELMWQNPSFCHQKYFWTLKIFCPIFHEELCMKIVNIYLIVKTYGKMYYASQKWGAFEFVNIYIHQTSTKCSV